MKRKINSKLRHIAETYRKINVVHINQRASSEIEQKQDIKQLIKQKIRSKLRNITETDKKRAET